jgi:hypothetical protein
LKIPEEIALREERKAKLEERKRVMEERFEKAKREKEEKEREKAGKSKNEGGKGGGKGKPLEKYQYNFTGPESRIMKAGNGQHFEQSTRRRRWIPRGAD